MVEQWLTVVDSCSTVIYSGSISEKAEVNDLEFGLKAEVMLQFGFCIGVYKHETVEKYGKLLTNQLESAFVFE